MLPDYPNRVNLSVGQVVGQFAVILPKAAFSAMVMDRKSSANLPSADFVLR
jgi:hypothetical protein